MNPYVRRFKQALGLGMTLNVLMILGLFAAPSAILELLGIPAPVPIWPRTVALLLSLISVAYVPALMDPLRYRPAAYYTLGVRVSGVLFFGSAVLLGAPLGFVVFALYDAIFIVLQGIPLYLALRRENNESGHAGMFYAKG
jgi:hypothetical protein